VTVTDCIIQRNPEIWLPLLWRAYRIGLPPTVTRTRTPTRPLPTPTRTFTPTRTPTRTATAHFTPTATPTRGVVTAVFQQGLDGYAGAADTWIDMAAPTKNYHAPADAGWLRAYTSAQRNILLRFELAIIPAGSTVLEATLELYISQRSNANALTVDVHRLLRAWQDSEATWEQASADVPWQVAGAGGDADRDPTAFGALALNKASGWVSVPVTELAQSWVDRPAENYGCVLRGRPGGGVLYTLPASENATAGLRPRLTVRYETP